MIEGGFWSSWEDCEEIEIWLTPKESPEVSTSKIGSSVLGRAIIPVVGWEGVEEVLFKAAGATVVVSSPFNTRVGGGKRERLVPKREDAFLIQSL